MGLSSSRSLQKLGAIAAGFSRTSDPVALQKQAMPFIEWESVFWVGKEGIGGEFGELAAPEVGAQDALGRHPAAVDRGQGLDGTGILAAD